jgi:hypothetical protein
MKLGKAAEPRSRRIDLAGWLALAAALVLGLMTTSSSRTATLPRRAGDLIARLNLGRARGDLPTLIVDIAFADYNAILAQRERALAAGGVNLAGAEDFVDATLRQGETTVDARLRLRQGLIPALGADDKWPFEVRVADDAPPLFGYRRFYLQEPVPDGVADVAEAALAQRAFSEALQRESILTARPRFVRLVVNGDDRGRYMLQEGFGEALLADQGRAPGVVVAFDADRLLASIAHFRGSREAAFSDPVTNLAGDDFRYFEIDTYRDADIAADPLLAEQKDDALALLYALQTGELPASQVFDVAQYGRFLALVDLWGAAEATSLLNLSFYYNPTTSKLEPIAFNAHPLAGDHRISLAATYADPQIQAAYVREAARLSDPDYLAEVRAELGPALAQIQRSLGADAATSRSLWEALSGRQALIRRSLNPVRPVFAHQERTASPPYDAFHVKVGNPLNLPVEILGFDVDGATFLEVDRAWIVEEETPGVPAVVLGPESVPAAAGPVLRAYDGARAAMVSYVQFDVPLTAIHAVDEEVDFNRDPELRVAVRILGAERTHLVPVSSGPVVTPGRTPPSQSEGAGE